MVEGYKSKQEFLEELERIVSLYETHPSTKAGAGAGKDTTHSYKGGELAHGREVGKKVSPETLKGLEESEKRLDEYEKDKAEKRAGGTSRRFGLRNFLIASGVVAAVGGGLLYSTFEGPGGRGTYTPDTTSKDKELKVSDSIAASNSENTNQSQPELPKERTIEELIAEEESKGNFETAATMAEENGQNDRAKSLYLKAINSYEDSKKFYEAAKLAEKRGLADKVIDNYIKHYEKTGNQFDVNYVRYAEDLAKKQNKRQALRRILKVFEKADCLDDAAELSEYLGDTTKAITFYKKIGWDFNVARLYAKRKDMKRAREYYDKGIAFSQKQNNTVLSPSEGESAKYVEGVLRTYYDREQRNKRQNEGAVYIDPNKIVNGGWEEEARRQTSRNVTIYNVDVNNLSKYSSSLLGKLAKDCVTEQKKHFMDTETYSAIRQVQEAINSELLGRG